jgi:hypothetical protein
MEVVCLPLPFPLKTFLDLLKKIHNLCLSQIVQFVGFIMHAKILLLHYVDALTTYFAWVYIWRVKPLFVLVPLVKSFYPHIGFHYKIPVALHSVEVAQAGNIWFKSFKVCQT